MTGDVQPRTRYPLTLVAAVGRNGVIGAAGTLPWRLPGDLAHFRALTMGHPLLMGRITYDTIGRPLPGRATTVMSRQPGVVRPGIAVMPDLAGALASTDRQADELGALTVMVVGGAEIYAQTINLAQRLLITEVAAEPRGDALFPVIDLRVWRKVSARVAEPDAADTCNYSYVCWERHAQP